MSTTYEQLGQQIGAIVEQKSVAYGDSITKVDAMMRILYPDGIAPSQVAVFGILNRTLDKIVRIVTDNDPNGENPWIDGAGYMLRGAMFHEERKSKRCGSVSGVDAVEESPEPSDSAAKNANEPTTPNEAERSEQMRKQHSSKPSSDTSASTAASAPSVMVSASGREGDRLSASCDAVLTRLRMCYPEALRVSELQAALGTASQLPIYRIVELLTARRFAKYDAKCGYSLTQEGVYYWNRVENLI